MRISEAIKILQAEKEHTQHHLQYKDKAPEYYKEMQKYCDALTLAIGALENTVKSEQMIYDDGAILASGDWE